MIIGIFIDSMPMKCIDQIPIPKVTPPAIRQNSAALRGQGILPALSKATNKAINATK
ncbi:hypothetical protein ACP3P6_21970 [Enterobacter mori]